MTAEEKTAKIEDYIARLDAEWPEIEKIMASHELDLAGAASPLSHPARYGLHNKRRPHRV